MELRSLLARHHPNLRILRIVKTTAILGMILVQFVYAEEVPATPPIPSIVARTFHLGIQRRSNSNLTYMLKAPEDGAPALGRILLIRRENEPIIALRVLKDYPEKKEFAAKRVRRYADNRVLDTKESNYLAIEKVSDLDGVYPEPTPQDQADLKELEGPPPATASAVPPATGGTSSGAISPAQGAIPPDADPAASVGTESAEGPLPQTSEYDPELDSGTSPEPTQGQLQPDEENSGVTVEEIKPHDPYRHMVTAQFGALTNYSPVSDHHLFTGGGVRYSFTPWNQVLLRKPSLQDSFSFEGGVFIYKIVKMLAGTGSDASGSSSIDTYTVLPLSLTVRYNLTFSENFSVFAYGGLLLNFVVGATAAFQEALDMLNTFGSDSKGNFRFSPVPAFGTGILWRVGPNWAVRGDVGFDFIGAGLVLKF